MKGSVDLSSTETEYQTVQIGPETLNIPKEWDVDELDNLATRFISGGTPDSDEESYWGGDIPWTTCAVVEGPYFSGQKDFITEDGLNESSASIVPAGSLLFGTRVNVANVGLAEKEIAISQDLTGIVLDEDKVVPSYLAWYLLFNQEKIRDRYSQGSTIQGMITSDLRSLSILLPPLPEQHRIVDVLDAANTRAQQADDTIRKTEELNQGLSQDLLFDGINHDSYQAVQAGPKEFEIPEAWSLSTVGDITARLRNGIAEKQNHDGEGIPVTRIETIADGFVDRDSIGWMDLEPEEYEEFKLQKGDILFSHKNSLEHLGKTAQYWSEETLYHGENLLLLRPDETVVNPRFAYFFLNGETIRQICRSFAKKSVSQVSLNQKEVSALPIPLPPMEEQDRIVEILDKGEEKLREERATKEALQGLKRGLMQDLLTGKRRLETDD